jgi:tetratricopeptide (TPR) repeat protein
MAAATALYPDDPRAPAVLRELAAAQLAAGDPFGAHLAYRSLLRSGPAAEPSALVARAAANAAAVRDMGSALAWASSLLESTELSEDERVLVHLAVLKAGSALGRHETALASARALASLRPAALRLDPQAILAAARTRQALGLLDEAITDYEIFANIHSAAVEHAEALLALARLQARGGTRARAGRTLSWLVEMHPQSPAALSARIDLLELESPAVHPAQIDVYLALMREASDMAAARTLCDRLVGRFVPAGYSFELARGLAGLAERGGADLAPVLAKKCLADHLEAMIVLLTLHDDQVRTAATAIQAEALGLVIPRAMRDRVERARLGLGLEPGPPSALEVALRQAAAQLAAGDFAAAAGTAEAIPLRASEADPELAARALGVLAEAAWRAGEDPAALARLDEALALRIGEPVLRTLHVLRADVTFAGGDRAAACESYHRAHELGTSPWVERQLAVCAAPAGGGGA